MITKAIALAKSIVNLEVFDISDYHKKEDGTVDISTFFGEKIMRFAEEYKYESMSVLLKEFMEYYNSFDGELDVDTIITKFCDRKSTDETTI